MAAKTMTKANSGLDDDGSQIIDLREKVTLYAPNDADKKDTVYHQPGEATDVHPNQVEKFKAKGYTEEPVESKTPKSEK